MQKKIKQENGSMTAWVLTSIFVILIVLVNIYVAVTNQRRSEKEEFRKIQEAYGMTETEMEEVYQQTINGQTEKVNPPEMLTGMKKIMFTEPTEDKKGEVVKEGEADFKKNGWYSYKDKKWANAQTEDGSMWVWIPRFAYKIESSPEYNSDGTTEKAGTIKVKFLIGTSDEYYDDDGTIQKAQRKESTDQTIDTKEYTVHPAFTNETTINYANGGWNKELTGIWVSKFEAGYASGNNNAPVKESSEKYSKSTLNWLDGVYGSTETKIKYPTFQGVSYAMNYINADDAFYISQALTESGNIYGLTNTTDSHLIKNSEWGAVAYLSQSEYGLGGMNIYINNVTLNNGNEDRTSNEGKTGVESVYAVTGVTGGTEDGNPRIADITNINNTKENTPSIEGVYTWNQQTGEEASTTGTIYGVYDLSGGLSEITASYLANSGGLAENGANFANGKNSQYVMIYSNKQSEGQTTDNASETNYQGNSNIYGDAIYETSKNGYSNTSWFRDYSCFANAIEPFFRRGGNYEQADTSGIFGFYRDNGASSYNLGFRTVLVAK